MAMAFGYENQYKKALKLDQESAQFFYSEGDTLRWLVCLNNVGFDLSMLERQKECRLIYKQALEVATIADHKIDQVLCATNLANSERDAGKFDEAERLLFFAEVLAKKENVIEHLPRIYGSFGELFIQTNRLQKAIDAFAEAASLKDSLFSIQMTDRYSQLRTRYETEQKEQEKEILSKENLIQKARLENQQIYIFSGIVAFFLIILTIWLGYQRKQLIDIRKLEAERYSTQEKMAKEILNAEEKERGRIARAFKCITTVRFGCCCS